MQSPERRKAPGPYVLSTRVTTRALQAGQVVSRGCVPNRKLVWYTTRVAGTVVVVTVGPMYNYKLTLSPG